MKNEKCSTILWHDPKPTNSNNNNNDNYVFNKPVGFHGGSIYRASSYQDFRSSAVARSHALEVLSVIVLDVLKK